MPIATRKVKYQTVRLDTATKNRLAHIAAVERRTVSQIIYFSILEYLKNWKEPAA
jgi:predicted transcriptional regulator